MAGMKKGEAPRRISDKMKVQYVIRAAKLQEKGYNLREACEEIGISPSSMTRWRTEGIGASTEEPVAVAAPMPTRVRTGTGNKVPDDERRLILTEWNALRAGGMTKKDASERVGRSPSLLTLWERRMNGAAPTGGLPTTAVRPGGQQGARKARKLVPVMFACPHCAGPIKLDQ